jgi:hypothetical protein
MRGEKGGENASLQEGQGDNKCKKKKATNSMTFSRSSRLSFSRARSRCFS